jgi:hypothetical protein
MMNDRSIRQITFFAVLALVAFSVRFLPYIKEQHESWLLCLWGANAVLPLLMLTVSQSKSLFLGYALPFFGFVISDVIIQTILQAKGLTTSSLNGRLVIYAMFFGLSQLGLILRWLKLNGLARILAGVGLTLTGSILFFLISNGLVWYYSTPAAGEFYYAPTWAGLLRCYELALPFFRNQFLGDAIFSVVFFGVYAVYEQQVALRVRQLTAAA